MTFNANLLISYNEINVTTEEEEEPRDSEDDDPNSTREKRITPEEGLEASLYYTVC